MLLQGLKSEQGAEPHAPHTLTSPPAPYRGFAPGPTGGTFVLEPPDWSVFILGLSGGIHPTPQKKKYIYIYI